MKFLLTICIIGIAIFSSCSRDNKSAANSINEEKAVESTTVLKTRVKDFSAGKKVFAENCVRCHGEDGKAQKNQAKDLSISKLSIDESIKIISTAQTISERGHEPRFKETLSDNDINEVAEYIVALRK